MTKENKKNITFGAMLWNGINMGLVAFLIMFIIEDLPAKFLINSINLSFYEAFFILPITFLMTFIPGYWMNKQPFTKEINKGINNELFMFSKCKLAIIYVVNCSMEELLFRVAIQGCISMHIGNPLAIIITSALFVLAHFRYLKYWQMVIGTISAGIIWGTVYALSGSWILVSLAHFLNNFILSSIESKKLKLEI